MKIVKLIVGATLFIFTAIAIKDGDLTSVQWSYYFLLVGIFVFMWWKEIDL